MYINFEQTVVSVLAEGDGVEGFDLPPRYPLKPGRVFKRVYLPGSSFTGEKSVYWYIETKLDASNEWAINRAVTAQLRRNNIPEQFIQNELFKYLRHNSPSIKTVDSQEIPNNEKNITFLKK